jgi:hypothetical protein
MTCIERWALDRTPPDWSNALCPRVDKHHLRIWPVRHNAASVVWKTCKIGISLGADDRGINEDLLILLIGRALLADLHFLSMVLATFSLVTLLSIITIRVKPRLCL